MSSESSQEFLRTADDSTKPKPDSYLYEFGSFRIAPAKRLLERENRPVALQPKAFDTLLMLVQNPDKVVLKEEFMAAIWPDTCVEEANLTQCIFVLRKALEETTGERRYIITVPGRGYRFAEKVRTIRKETRVLPVPTPEQVVAPARRRIVLPIAAAAILLMAAAGYFELRRPHRLSEKDAVVLADFVNTTGDPIFDHALRQALSAQLEQSPYLNLASDQKIGQTVKSMAKPKDARLTAEVAREVCQRIAGGATVEGSIAILSKQYVLGIKAIGCSNGEVLAQEFATADTKEQVLQALGQAVSKLRARLGEPLRSVEKLDAPAEGVTTRSLEALAAYSMGSHALTVNNESATAIPFFQSAVNLDPEFAMAYARLGSCYLNLGETLRAAENTSTAYRLRDRASERERLYISAHYQVFVTGDLEAARELYELWTQTYPRDYGPHNELGIVYRQLGQHEKGLEQSLKAFELNPGSAQVRSNLGAAYLIAGRLDDAARVIREARAENLDAPANHFNQFLVDFLHHDRAAMERDEAGLVGKPGFEFRRIHLESSIARYAGRVTQARELNRKAVDAALVRDEMETAAGFLADAALAEALAGNFAEARKQAGEAVELANGKVVEGRSAVALALSREQDHARRLADDLNGRFPTGHGRPIRIPAHDSIRPGAALRRSEEGSGGACPRRAVRSRHLHGVTPRLPARAGAGRRRRWRR